MLITSVPLAKIKNFRFHNPRECTITSLFLNGFFIVKVSVVSGHKNWSELKRYTKILPVGKFKLIKLYFLEFLNKPLKLKDGT
jgi:hypothetical protein